MPLRGRKRRWLSKQHDDLVLARGLRRCVAGRSRHAERAAGGAGGKKEGQKRSEQGNDRPAQALKGKQQPGPARRSHHRAVRAKFISNTSTPTRCRDEALPLGRRHRREIVHVQLALVTKALFRIAAHRLPLLGARLPDAERWWFWFHITGFKTCRRRTNRRAQTARFFRVSISPSSPAIEASKT